MGEKHISKVHRHISASSSASDLEMAEWKAYKTKDKLELHGKSLPLAKKDHNNEKKTNIASDQRATESFGMQISSLASEVKAAEESSSKPLPTITKNSPSPSSILPLSKIDQSDDKSMKSTTSRSASESSDEKTKGYKKYYDRSKKHYSSRTNLSQFPGTRHPPPSRFPPSFNQGPGYGNGYGYPDPTYPSRFHGPPDPSPWWNDNYNY